MPPAVFSLNFFGFSDLLWFHVNLGIVCSISVKNVTVILIGFALNVQVALGSVVIFTILILPIQKHSISLYLFMSFLIFSLGSYSFLSTDLLPH